ncbi:MAG: hypothetical protein D6766_13040, partial [Verrucomicrobia bacterium]
ADQPELKPRVRLGRVWLGYVWLSLWDRLRRECQKAGAEWPLPESRADFAREWLDWTRGEPDKPWTQIRLIRERGTTPEQWVQRWLESP